MTFHIRIPAPWQWSLLLLKNFRLNAVHNITSDAFKITGYFSNDFKWNAPISKFHLVWSLTLRSETEFNFLKFHALF